MRKVIFIAALATLAFGCKPNPADCTDKHDINACRKLCETGSKDYEHLCFAERAFKMADCVDKGAGCDEACKDWKSREEMAKMGDETANLYKANIGAKYDQMGSKCGGATPPTPGADGSGAAGSAAAPAGGSGSDAAGSGSAAGGGPGSAG